MDFHKITKCAKKHPKMTFFNRCRNITDIIKLQEKIKAEGVVG
jgi:hypothetical protein